MQLDKEWRIEPDANSWNLIYEAQGDINPNTGEPTTARATYYHGRLEFALKHYLDETLKDSPDVRSVLARIDQAADKIDKFCADKTWETLKQLDSGS